jgi:protein-tyrosine phosphatase
VSTPTVTVERESGELVLRWTPASADDRLVVGTSPDEADGHTVAHDGTGERHLTGLDPRVRHYVHLHHGERVTVAAERLVPLEGTLNFRDLGGYRTADGRQVRWGRVFRSDALGTLTDADLTYLEHLGVRLICDFRDDLETQRAPSRVPDHPDLRIERFPIGAGGDTNNVSADRQDGLTDLVLAGKLGEVSAEMLGDFYVGMLESRSEPLVSVLERVADPANHPLVFHCTAGKDRTGVLAAMLLSVLGVGRETILDDYELTDRYRTPHRLAEVGPRLAAKGVDLDKVRALFSAQRAVLARTLDTIDARYGSVPAFLTGEAGMEPATLDRLRDHLLV